MYFSFSAIFYSMKYFKLGWIKSQGLDGYKVLKRRYIGNIKIKLVGISAE